MNEQIIKAVNEQINKEFYSAYLYLAMSAAASENSLVGFANWFMIQAQEERDHAMGLYNHLIDRGVVVSLTEIAKPDYKYVGPMDLLNKSLEHEQYITKSIHQLYALAEAEKDYALRTLLDWYVKEQVEEEGSLKLLIDQIKMTGEKSGSFYMFDKSLGKRVYKQANVLLKN